MESVSKSADRSAFRLVCNPGLVNVGASRAALLFVKIEWDGKRLSMTGVEGPTANGNALGGCGQIVMSPWEFSEYADGWSPKLVQKLRETWDAWHLNDMQAGTPKQTAALRQAQSEGWKHTDYGAACAKLAEMGLLEDDGYKYGSAWLTAEVPDSVIEFLRGLPASTVRPAWC